MIQVLDCTLRDGGRIVDCSFSDNIIVNIAKGLNEAKIDIIEIGFLRDWHDVDYKGGSTFFTDVDQMRPYIGNSNSMYVAFVDYGMFDFDSLKECDGTSISGIRVGFTKKDFFTKRDDIKRKLEIVKNKGYKLFIQGVNTLSYSDKEVLELLDLVNEVEPFGFGIVDTYGAMYVDDVTRFFELIDNNLNKDVRLDFHSHNNYQLSFSLAQEMIKLSYGKRDLIIDGTLNGMGKVAGNLNTELLINFLVQKMNYDYEFNKICDLIDEYIYPYKEKYNWGYSIPAMISGLYQSHPNNVIYLTSKFRLHSRDINNLISMIEPEKRQRYDYDNIQQLYISYCATKIDDESSIKLLESDIKDKEVLVLVPGKSIESKRKDIMDYARANGCIVISVNYEDELSDYVFWGNPKRYSYYHTNRQNAKPIITSNIHVHDDDVILVNYYDLINKKYEYFENSTVMLLYLLRRISVKKIAIAGFDGFYNDHDNYIDDSFQNDRHLTEFKLLNREIGEMMEDYAHSMKYKSQISFVTDSIFEKNVIKGFDK